MKNLKLIFSFLIVICLLISSAILSAATIISDDFTGTTIDTSKWTEVDSAGIGGTVGNIQQNGFLTMVGNGAWGTNYVVTPTLYNRSFGNLEMEADITCSSSSTVFGIGYGDPGVLTGGGESYTLYSVSNAISFSRQSSNSNAENISTGFSCTNNVAFHVRIAIDATTGASVYINGSTTPAVTLTGGTFNNKGFFLTSFTGTAASVDNFSINGTTTPVAPDAPTNLNALAENAQVDLSWIQPNHNNGSSITDYIVQYKLASEPTTWTTFTDGVSTSTSAAVTGLTNGLSYNFRVSASNSIGTGVASSIATTTPDASIAFSDNFSGTTIDTSKWFEVDPAGLGGTTGSVTQNDSLSIVPTTGAWDTQNGLKTVVTYDRTYGDVSMEFNVTRSSCGSAIPLAAGYGDFDFTTMGSSSYIFIANNSNWEIYYWVDGVNQAGSPQILSGISSCTNNVPTTFKIVALQAGGAKVYVNGSGTASATLTGGTFTNKTFWIGSGLSSGGTVLYDDVKVIHTPVPVAPVGLSASAQDAQVGLSWTSGGDNGFPITDYVIDYKLNTASSWSVFSDGTSTSTSTIVTGLTNAKLYNFRVYAVNANGTSSVSLTVNATPVSATPTAPVATSVAISGSASQGEIITGTYRFDDVNANIETTSLYRWLRSDTAGGTYSAIPGATSINYTITPNDLNKYLKFEVTPVSNVIPTTGSAVLSSASAQVTNINYINQILSTGQSLSVGVNATPALTTTQPYSNVMLTGGAGGTGTGASFTPLIESSIETMSSSMANTITANSTSNNFQVVVGLHGVSGYTYSQLKKGTTPYSNGMTQVTNTKSAATLLGKTSRVIGVTTIHGETDNLNGVSGPTYQGYLEEWQHDYDTDVKAITGQTNDVILFLDQLSSFMAPYAYSATSEIPIYQLKAAEDNPGKIVLVTPKYFFNYSDLHHLTAQSERWLGEYYGKVIKKVIINHEAWRPLTPDSALLNGNVIYANFHVPAGILTFDTTLVSPRTNKGFEYYDSTSSASISNVEILDSDTVKITLSGVPTGSDQRLRYAYTGIPGTNTGAQNAGTAAGNLRDTDPYPSLYGNTLYNWAVHFDQPIILDQSAPTITNVSSDKTNGTYAASEVIDIDVTFSEPVTSTGNVTVTLETGDTDRTCTFTISNSTTGTCDYTVQAGDVSSDLTVKTISGIITDQAGNVMTDFIPAVNLASNKALVINAISTVTTIGGNNGHPNFLIINTTPVNTAIVATQKPSIFLRTLKFTYKGEDVKALQVYLNTHKYGVLVADGIFGLKTKQAVIKLQKKNKLTPDGIIGLKTIHFINFKN